LRALGPDVGAPVISFVGSLRGEGALTLHGQDLPISQTGNQPKLALIVPAAACGNL